MKFFQRADWPLPSEVDHGRTDRQSSSSSDRQACSWEHVFCWRNMTILATGKWCFIKYEGWIFRIVLCTAQFWIWWRFLSILHVWGDVWYVVMPECVAEVGMILWFRQPEMFIESVIFDNMFVMQVYGSWKIKGRYVSWWVVAHSYQDGFLKLWLLVFTYFRSCCSYCLTVTVVSKEFDLGPRTLSDVGMSTASQD